MYWKEKKLFILQKDWTNSVISTYTHSVVMKSFLRGKMEIKIVLSSYSYPAI